MYSEMTKEFSLSKTLRFELKPVFENEDFIENFESEFLKETVKRDKRRAEEYKQLKEIIDDYLRSYIDDTLSVKVLPDFEFNKAFVDYKNSQKEKKQWEERQKVLRNHIASLFKKDHYEVTQKFFNNALKPKLKDEPEKLKHIESFNRFTTYFTGFNENRKNIFTKEAQATAIGYRLIHDNLPKFYDACLLYEKIREKFTDLEFVIEEEWLQELGVTTLDELFEASAYAHLLTQKTIDTYNKLLGGYTTPQGTKVKGLNEQINLYRQSKGPKPRDLPTFAPLFKQILSEHESASFIPEAFEDDRELLEAIFVFVDRNKSKENHIKKIKKSFSEIENDENEKVYVQSKSLSELSNTIFGNWSVIEDALTQYAQEQKKHKNNRKKFLNQNFYLIDTIDRALKNYLKEYDDNHPYKKALASKSILDPYKDEMDNLENALSDTLQELNTLRNIEKISKNRTLPKDDNDKGGEGYQQIQIIKKTLDAYQNMVRHFRILSPFVNKTRITLEGANMAFYNAFEEPFVEFDREVTALYNKVRNYLSKKPFSREKFKLNFEAVKLLDGWDINKERDNRSVLLINDGKYYLAIMRPKHTDVFLNAPEGNSNDTYQKVNYKQVANPGNDIPNLMVIDGKTVSKKGRKDPNGINRQREKYLKQYLPEDIYKIKQAESYKTTSDNFNKKDLATYIAYYQERVKEYFSYFSFNFKNAEDYSSWVEFTNDVNSQGYQIWFTGIPSDYIEEVAKERKIFLFQIYNKDFSPYAKGRPNMHTLYWKSLFEPQNLQNVVTKLNGKAEIFFRYKSIKKSEAVVHKANQPIKNKNENNPKNESLFDYDITKDRRYTVDKFLFHVPITINFKQNKASKFNERINTLLSKHPNTHIIGIDRGERHLLYYTLISPDGKIIKQKSFNTIPMDKGYSIDYRKKLDAKEKERDRARKDWGSIENIKELKAGYLSQVVHELAKLIVDYSAIVVLEDLNFGFKRGRFKVEKQVYQKFEKALIDKLNYLVFKDRDSKEPGGYLNGYQLTAPFESFAKLGKQSGILFYVPAAYTSKIDPATGFIDFLKPKYESVEKSQTFFSKFQSIRYNTTKDYFEFAFNYKDFTNRDLKGYETNWTLCTHGIRLRNKKNNTGHWESITVDVTDDLKRLFDKHKIFYKIEEELKDEIVKKDEKSFFESLTYALKNMLAMRYSKVNSEEDYILSPVKDKNGNFYDSRKVDESMPKDADANGAYHIALKGAILLERLQNKDDATAKADLLITQQQWLAYVVEKWKS